MLRIWIWYTKDSEKAIGTFLEEIKEDIPEAQYQIGIAYRDGSLGISGG